MITDPTPWQEAERLSAELAKVTAERDRYREHSILLNSVQWTLAEVLGEVPDGATQIQHDPNRVSRLAELVASLRAELATARRDTAAATLTEHAQRLREYQTNVGPDAPTYLGFRRSAELTEQVAAEIRTGQRDVPGSEETT